MLTIKIKTDNQAFDDWKEGEIAKCLNKTSQDITNGLKKGKIYDTNGNPVGTFKLTNR